MKLKLKKIISFALGVLMLNSVTASADPLSTNESTSDEVIVEILYNANGNDFAENIVFDDGTKLSDYDYIVKTNPMPQAQLMMASSFYPIGDYFNYAAWITRDGVVSLSVDPKSDVRNSSTYRDAAWNVLASPTHGFGSSSNWDNTQVMHWQFDCHYSFAKSKTYWNLEPHRTASSYLQVVAAGCNP